MWITARSVFYDETAMDGVFPFALANGKEVADRMGEMETKIWYNAVRFVEEHSCGVEHVHGDHK